MLEKTLESPLDFKEIKPVHSKVNHSWILFGRADVEAEAPILWPPEAKSWLIYKVTDTRKDWRQEEKKMTEEDMVGWHHWLNEHEFEQAPGDGNGQGSLACCSLWGCKESDKTEWLNNNMGVRAYLVAQEGKESTCSAGDQGSIPRSGRSPGELNSYPLQFFFSFFLFFFFCLNNFTDRGALWATVHEIAESWTWLSD